MGGAAGHMNHPFDLGWVDTGSDLIDFFEKAKTFVEKKGAGAVKIDGVNVSFKVVGDEEKQFAVDRGSLKPIDIDGITMGRVDQRFPEGHGMRPAIKTLLAILNEALPDLKPQLEELGMWDDPSLFLNTEYVEGSTNVIGYDTNFLAIHGLNQFYHRIGKVGASKGIERPGAERPEGSKDASAEVPYDPKVMEQLIKKLNPIAKERGFEVYGSVPTEKTTDIDFEQTLSQPITIRIAEDREITKTLKEWLSEVNNPRYKVVTLKNGKKTHPLHKALYQEILKGEIPIVDLIEDSDAESAIYGAIMMHATRMLGNDILRALTSPMGDVVGHEGIVLRDEKLFGPKPVKITGEFIVGGLASSFQNVPPGNRDTIIATEEESVDLEIEDEDDDPVGPAPAGQTIAIVPGAFKPPHQGHADMVRKYASMADEVVVLISNPLKQQRTIGKGGKTITAEDSRKIWELLVQDLPNVTIEMSSMASPIQAAYEFIGEDGPLEPGTNVILGASRKGDDWKRWEGAEKYVKPGVNLEDITTSPVKPSFRSDGTPFSATDMRSLLENAMENIKELEEFIGEGNVPALLSILGLSAPMEEVSAASGGAGGGYSGNPFGRSSRRDVLPDPVLGKRDDKKKKKKTETIDLSIIDEVYELLIERGIIT
tara:strand:+ start:3280 stop:5238 length:1959 start_codon:yes stop_codon:yes gene_type:complete